MWDGSSAAASPSFGATIAKRCGWTKPWRMWALTAPGVVVHRIRDDKSAATFTALVGDYHGVIIADALSTHEAGARASPGIVLALGSRLPLLRRGGAGSSRRRTRARVDRCALHRSACRWCLALRAELRERRPILDEMKAWLWSDAEIRSLSIGKSAAYTLGICDRLTRFVDDARIPIDNNATADVRTTTDRSRVEAPRSRRCSTRFLSPVSSTQLTQPRTSRRQTATKCCFRGASYSTRSSAFAATRPLKSRRATACAYVRRSAWR